jgi:hypothetical protein
MIDLDQLVGVRTIVGKIPFYPVADLAIRQAGLKGTERFRNLSTISRFIFNRFTRLRSD